MKLKIIKDAGVVEIELFHEASKAPFKVRLTMDHLESLIQVLRAAGNAEHLTIEFSL